MSSDVLNVMYDVKRMMCDVQYVINGVINVICYVLIVTHDISCVM